MRIRDLLSEAKAAIPPKPRNFVAKNAINTGAGQHKDKKRAEKQGDVKHKKQVEPAEDVAEGASLKKAKREYNQAAKDAGGDWAGAGKKIDNMKKGLRQKDVGKEKEVAEISDNTLKNYRQGAHTQVQGAKFGKGKGTPEAEKIIAKREKGMAAAGQRQQARRDAAKAKQPPREIPKTSSGPQDWYGQNRYMGDSVEQGMAEGSKVKTAKGHGDVVQGTNVKTVAKADLGKNKLNLPKGYGDVVQPQKLKSVAKAQGVAEAGSNAVADTAKRLTNKDDGKVAKLRAAGDKRREDELKGRNIAKRNESVDLKTSLQESKKDVVGSSYSIFKIK